MSTRRVPETIGQLAVRSKTERDAARFVAGNGDISTGPGAFLGRGLAAPVVGLGGTFVSVNVNEPPLIVSATLDPERWYLIELEADVIPVATDSTYAVVFAMGAQNLTYKTLLSYGSSTPRSIVASYQFSVGNAMHTAMSGTVTTGVQMLEGSKLSVRDIGPFV